MPLQELTVIYPLYLFLNYRNNTGSHQLHSSCFLACFLATLAEIKMEIS
jgi:hypothetical protein